MKKYLFYLKKILNKINSAEFFILLIIAVTASSINILHVIYNSLKTPPGYFYTGTGHYYLDYFFYLQIIGQGMRGKWLPINYVAPLDNFVWLLELPYIILGKLAVVFHLSAVAAYWCSIFILTIIVIFIIYWVINYILRNYPFYLKMSALLITIYTSPFYFFKNGPQGREIIPYDFWWGPQTFLRRFGVVPHQLIVSFLILLVFIASSFLIEKINSDKLKAIIKKILLINMLLIIILFISPVSLVIPLITITTILFFNTFYQILKLKKLSVYFPFFLFILSISLLLIPTAIILKIYYEQSTIIAQLRAQDISWSQYVPLSFLLLNIGPVLFFLPFGLVKLIKIKIPIVFLLLLSTALTYIFYYTPLATFFGTHNLRFFGLTNYILFGILAVLGIEFIVEFLHLKKKFFSILLILILLIIFSVLNYFEVELRLFNKDERIPIVTTSYLPKDLKETFSVLNREKSQGCTLTDPYNYMGMVVPIYVERKSCIGIVIDTPDFAPKQIQADLFLRGKMNEAEAKEFLNKNGIRYILLTWVDQYSGIELGKYKFIKKIFINAHSKIFKYN